jgi:toxin ParE1/3/4
MTKTVQITFADSALTDLEDIRYWYNDLRLPHVGERLLQEIIEQVELLQSLPEMGRIVPEFGIKSIRELILPPFRIVYRHDRERVRVVRVWRSERLLKLNGENKA